MLNDDKYYYFIKDQHVNKVLDTCIILLQFKKILNIII